MDSWLVTLIGIQVAFVAFLIWIAVNYRQKSLQRRSEERLRIVERFSSGTELGEFLATERGARFLEMFAVRPKEPTGIILTGVVSGILLLFGGGAFLVLVRLEDSAFIIPAVVLLAGGLGIVVATAVSFRLARKLRLLAPHSKPLSESLELE